MTALVTPIPATFCGRRQWLAELDEAVAEDVYRLADTLLDQTGDLGAIHEVALGLSRYLASRITATVEMAADTWAATQ